MSSLKWIKLRILLTSLGFVIFLGCLLFRSYHLQVAKNGRLFDLASHQYQARLPVVAKRGTIVDRNGQALAIDVQVASVGIHPSQIKNADPVILQLSSVLKLSKEKIKAKLNSSKKFEWVTRRISAETGDVLRRLKLDGVVVATEYKRFYPNKEIAGHLLGAVGYDAKALGGLELAFDNFLKSFPQSQLAEKDAKGRLFTPVASQEIFHDIHLTIDLNLQFIAEKYLRENAQKYKAKSGFALIIDPHTGEILAMANYPFFNPNLYWEYPAEHWKNHALIDTFEPGSTFKAVLVSSALDTGKVNPESLFFCENGTYQVEKRTIHDHAPYGNMTVKDIIKVSSNIGVTKIAQKIGKQALYDTIVALGFGQKPGLDFPGEEQGILRNVKGWSALDQSNIAFGQGISVTGLQMAQAYATFANSGIRMKSFLLSKVVSSEGEEILRQYPSEAGVVLKSRTATQVTQMLEGVVDEGGTGQLANLEGYPVAGKTGTAQKVDSKTRQYAPGKYVSSFIGYVPASSPEFVIYVVYDTPTPQYYGGVVAAPVFKNIAREALAYRGVPPVAETRLARQGNL